MATVDAPEEGEILSDDLEDISDDSIVFTLNAGKSLSHSDPLHALPLSNVSDAEESPAREPRKRRKSYAERRKRKRSKRQMLDDSDSSDNDSTIDSRLKRQLKAAVRVNVEEAHRNSLRTRLKAMVKSESEPEPQQENVVHKVAGNSSPITIIDLVEQESLANNCIEILESESENPLSASEAVNSPSDPSKETDIDNELIQLRLEALKTAINNKYRNKKKRKNDGGDDTNKENTSNNSEENQEKKTLELVSPQTSTGSENNTPISPEEDEDILRAILLASMSKKITSKSPNLVIQPKNSSLPKQPTQVKKTLNNGKKIVNGVTKLIQIPQVKPLIININSDSDSDMDLSSESSEKMTKRPHDFPEASETIKNSTVLEKDENTLEANVDKFLRDQRAKVESQVANEVKTNNVQTQKALPALVKHSTITRHKKDIVKEQKIEELEKSTLKYLPANKLEEYKKLKSMLMLKKAQMNKPRVDSTEQFISFSLKSKTVLNNPTSNKIKLKTLPNQNPKTPLPGSQPKVQNKMVQTIDHGQLPEAIEARVHRFKSDELQAHRRQRARTKHSLILRTTLKQMQTEINGRLQMQDKYKILRTSIKALNEVSKEQKVWDQKVTDLLEELKKARDKQEQLHATKFTAIKRLIEAKREIDSASLKAKRVITSTPIKQSVPIDSLPLSSPIISDSDSKDKTLTNTWEQSTVCAGSERQNRMNGVTVEDPNDIDSIIKITEERMALLEDKRLGCKQLDKVRYVSPLNVSQRNGTLDPFGIMCPFEVNGMCKDPECSFNHLPN